MRNYLFYYLITIFPRISFVKNLQRGAKVTISYQLE